MNFYNQDLSWQNKFGQIQQIAIPAYTTNGKYKDLSANKSRNIPNEVN
jgi:hypothetical protein